MDKMKLTEEDADVFEITDFTTASEWERFDARLEEIIHEWRLTSFPPPTPLNKGELTCGTWQEKVDKLRFADFEFTITRHWLKRPDEKESSPPESKDDASSSNSSSEAQEVEAPPSCWLDLTDIDNDFPSRAHCLVRWYGIRDFMVLAPAGAESINSESRANLVLSSIAIALHNTGCSIPVFVQVHQKWRRLYFGQCTTSGFNTSFEMVHLKQAPQQYSHLAGLLDVFKAKLNSPLSPLPPVTVSVRFTFILQDWPHYSWPQQPPDIDSMIGGEVGCADFGELPFGACEDPVSELHLSTTWPSLSEEMIVDNDVYTDLDPLQAPIWSVRVRMTDDVQCLLSDYVEEFIHLCKRKESTEQLLGKISQKEDPLNDADISQALHKLTEPAVPGLPSLGTVVTKATSKLQIKPEEAPIPADTLNGILFFLFPDAKDDSDEDESLPGNSTAGNTPAASPSGSGPQAGPGASGPAPGGPEKGDSSKRGSMNSSSQLEYMAQFKELFRQFKSAPVDSLTYRLAVCMCIVNHSYGGLRAVAHLWQEFVLEMRYRWEHNYLVPDLDPGSPNLGCSLLHQKLQMLNCCIKHKMAREQLTQSQGGATGGSPRSLDDVLSVGSSSDDEFFECEENENKKPNNSPTKKASKDELNRQVKADASKTSQSGRIARSGDQTAGQSEQPAESCDSQSEAQIMEEVFPSESKEKGFRDSLEHQPEGRLRPCEGLKLLNAEANMYIPITQEPAPMTEDILEEHAEVLAKLGTSAEGASLRARMQSACLLSDMEAFKAANPGCVLGDFVRWYSPRDWVEEDVMDEDGTTARRGQLSQRMQIPGNMWLEVWQSAKPTPVRRQKRLFDDTKEAEKVLHFLASMKPCDIAIRLMPMLFHSAIGKVMEQEDSSISVIKSLVEKFVTKATKVMRQPRPDIKKYEDLTRQLCLLEVLVTQAQSLRTKFSQDKEVPGVISDQLHQFIASLLENAEVPVSDGSRSQVGQAIHALFAAAQKSAYLLPEDEEEETTQRQTIPDFPSPSGKEYILRTTAARPAPWSRISPQRMYCIIMRDEFRLAGAFTADTTFQ